MKLRAIKAAKRTPPVRTRPVGTRVSTGTALAVGSRGRRLLARTDDGEIAIDLPAKARFTFGPDVPGKVDRGSTYAIRVYRTARNDSLCAVVPHVHGCREADIGVHRVALTRVTDSGTVYRMIGHYDHSTTSQPQYYDLWQRPLGSETWKGPFQRVATEEQAEALITQVTEAENRLVHEDSQGKSAV